MHTYPKDTKIIIMEAKLSVYAIHKPPPTPLVFVKLSVSCFVI